MCEASLDQKLAVTAAALIEFFFLDFKEFD